MHRHANGQSTTPDPSRRGFLTGGLAGLLAMIALRLPRSLAPRTPSPPDLHPTGKTTRFRPKENYHV
jgi:hypothetical protein